MFSQGKPNQKPITLALLLALGVTASAHAGAVTVTGDITWHYGAMSREGNHYHANVLETCVYVNGKLNDNWSVDARIENDQDFTDNDFDGKTEINQYWATGKVAGLRLTAGKAPVFLVNGNVYDDTAKIVSLSYGKTQKLSAYYGEPEDFGYDRFYGASFAQELGTRWKFGIGYDKFVDALADIKDLGLPNNVPVGKDNAIWNGYVSHRYRDVEVCATYLDSDIDDGYVINTTYKGADKLKPGSFGIRANWYDQGNGTYVVHTMYGDKDMTGFKGYMLATDFTVAKNVVATVEYYDLENKADNSDVDTVWSKLMIAF